jgi:phosphoglycerate kinase
MKLPSIDDFNMEGKTVILRVDINSPVKNKKVIMSERIEEAAKSIQALLDKKARVIVLAHQGRKGSEDFTSLEQHSRLLNNYVKIKFMPDILGEKAEEAIKNLKLGEAILLENVRFLAEESSKGENNDFVKKLSGLAEFYVNDAFSVCHREQASVTGFPRVMKSCFGSLIIKELEALEKIKIGNALYILAGSKTEENLPFLRKNKRIIACGMFGQLCMLAQGFRFGKHEEFVDTANLENVKEKIAGLDLITPVDFAVKEKGRRKEMSLDKFPNSHEIFDIGEKTISIFRNEILKAKAVFMKGPAGYIEEKQFQKGTKEIFNAIIKSKALSVLGGGHLSTAIHELKFKKEQFSHISLSGGALASYVAGEKLPGIEAILNKT